MASPIVYDDSIALYDNATATYENIPYGIIFDSSPLVMKTTAAVSGSVYAISFGSAGMIATKPADPIILTGETVTIF